MGNADSNLKLVLRLQTEVAAAQRDFSDRYLKEVR